MLHAVSFATAPPSLLSLHPYRSDRLTPPGAQSLPVPPLFSRVQRFCPAHSCVDLHVYTDGPSPGHIHSSARASLYTLTTKPPQVAASAYVSAAGPVAPPCSGRLLSHHTLLWHLHHGHPSLPCLRGMHSRLLVSGLPRSLPPFPPSPALPCLLCIEGRQRVAPHSLFPLTISPLQTLHMDMSAQPASVDRAASATFLLILDDYTRYTTVFPLRDFCRGEGILQPFTLPASPQQNGIAERHIGLVMEVACTSMMHAAAPHFLWPFAVQCAAHQLNLWPHVSLARDLADTALDKGGRRCAGVPGLRLSCLCSRYVRGQALRPCCSLCLPWLSP
ncbi:unnamed protein product [Closterium sp. NIES-53]